MQNARGVFMNQVPATTCDKVPTVEPGNRHSQDQYSQDLFDPKWRGPFEGYR